MTDTLTFIAGGIDGDNYNDFGTDMAWMYDWKNNTWEKLPLMRIQRNEPACGLDTDTGKVIVAGGDIFGSMETDSTEIYDHVSKTWSKGQNIPKSTAKMVNMSPKGPLILVGMAHDVFSQELTSLLKYQSRKNLWMELHWELKVSKSGHVAIPVSDKIASFCSKSF